MRSLAVWFDARADDTDGLGQEVVEGVLGLLSEFTTVAKEQHALDPPGPDKQIGQRDRDAGLAGAGRLDDQRLAVLVGEALGNPLDRLDLIEAIDDLLRWAQA